MAYAEIDKYGPKGILPFLGINLSKISKIVIMPPIYIDKIKVDRAPENPNQVDIIKRNLLSPNPKASFFIKRDIKKFRSSKERKKQTERKKYL